MDPHAYRRKVAEELKAARKRREEAQGSPPPANGARRARGGPPAGRPSDRAQWTARIADRGAGQAARAEALLSLNASFSPGEVDHEGLAARLADATEAPEVRLAALRVLQGATFLGPMAAGWRPRYRATLRAITRDVDVRVRREALAILAREKDPFAQKLLLDGLKSAAAALIPAEEALQLLSYDIHSEVTAVARALLNSPATEAVRMSALRVLAASADARTDVMRILADVRESGGVRRLAAVALRSLSPGDFLETAASIVGNHGDDEAVRATCLTGLVHSAGAAASERVRKLVEDVVAQTPFPGLRARAETLLERLRKWTE